MTTLTRLADEVWKICGPYVPNRYKVHVALQLIDEFERAGCSEIYETDVARVAGASEDSFKFEE